jgi:tripartite-type tricarboxylate transporter receptor subunit TctC
MKHPLVLGCCTALIAWSCAIHAQNFPTKPVRVVVPYAPGGGNDVVIRVIAPRLSERLGQTLVIDNRAGAASMLGTEIVARAPRDGYTLLICDTAHVINPAVYRKVPYHPINDFEPIAVVASTPLMVVSHPGVPATSLRELVALTKSQPGKIVLAFGGVPAQMLAELFRLHARADFTMVPYKGTGPALTDVMAGQIQSTVTSTPSAIPLMKAGRLRGLGVASAKRTPAAPDVPTFAEAGMGDIIAENWYGIQGPAGIPAAARTRLERDLLAVAQSTEMRDRFLGMALDPAPMTSAEFKALVAADLKKWSDLVKVANIKVE